MKKIGVVLMCLLVVFTVNAKQHKKKKKQQSANKIESVEMGRTACFGRCPVYTININKNGLVTYTAKMFNADTGVFQKNIGASQAMGIINQFNTIKIDTFQELYESRVQDLPGITYTIHYKSTTKNIRNANFGPVILRQLAATMDGVGKKTDDTWKKVSSEVK